MSIPRGFNLAFYKGTRPGLEGLQNRIGRYIDRGPYSHVELVFSDGRSASSSLLDGGVRFKNIGYTSVGNWDFLPLNHLNPAMQVDAMKWFSDHVGKRYDWLGNIRFATNFARDSANRWFCSESVMAALGFSEAYRYGPSGMVPLLSKYFSTKIVVVNG